MPPASAAAEALSRSCVIAIINPGLCLEKKALTDNSLVLKQLAIPMKKALGWGSIRENEKANRISVGNGKKGN
jgi:hypothetical protein